MTPGVYGLLGRVDIRWGATVGAVILGRGRAAQDRVQAQAQVRDRDRGATAVFVAVRALTNGPLR